MSEAHPMHTKKQATIQYMWKGADENLAAVARFGRQGDRC